MPQRSSLAATASGTQDSPQRSDGWLPFMHGMAANHSSARKKPADNFCGLHVHTYLNDLCAVYAALSAFCMRSDLNAARISDAKSSGSSHAAKCPPLSTSLK